MVSLKDARIQDMLILVYKCFANKVPSYLPSLLPVHNMISVGLKKVP